MLNKCRKMLLPIFCKMKLVITVLADVQALNTLRPRQNGRLFPDDIFKWIFMNENVWISLRISLKFVPKVRINNILTLVQIMAWCRPGDKPLSEPMMVRLLTHIRHSASMLADIVLTALIRHVFSRDFCAISGLLTFVFVDHADDFIQNGRHLEKSRGISNAKNIRLHTGHMAWTTADKILSHPGTHLIGMDILQTKPRFHTLAVVPLGNHRLAHISGEGHFSDNCRKE